MNLALLVMTDGRRDCIAKTIPSAMANLYGPIRIGIIHDDSGDPEYTKWLEAMFPEFRVVPTPGRSGFGGAIRSAWELLRQLNGLTHVFHLEDDFTFNRPVDLEAMAKVLDAYPYLAQMALRRQPWNEEERAAGGVVEMRPRDYLDVVSDEARWLEHNMFFTTNPSMYRRALLDVDWPEGAKSEGVFTFRLLEHGFGGVSGRDVRFGFWGHRNTGEAVHHHGHQRAGTGY